MNAKYITHSALWTSFLPQSIRRIRFNAAICDVIPEARSTLDVEARVTSFYPGSSTSPANFSGDVDIFNEFGEMEIQIEGLAVQGLATNSDDEDREFYLQTVYKRDPWTGFDELESPILPKINVDLEELFNHISSLVTPNTNSFTASNNIENALDLALRGSPYRHHMELLKSCSRVMPAILPGLIHEMKRENDEVFLLTERLSQVIGDISHRHPHISVLEINLSNMFSFTDAIREGLAPAHSSFISAYVPGLSVPSSPEQSQSATYSSIQLDEDNILGGLDEMNAPFDIVVICGHSERIATHDVRLHALQNLLRPGGFIVSVESGGHLLQDRLKGLLRGEKGRGTLTPSTSSSILDGSESTGTASVGLFQSKGSGFSLLIEQARNHIVDILRSPLSNLDRIRISGPVLIIGGRRAETNQIRSCLESVLSSLGCETSYVESLDRVTPQLLSGVNQVVLLADLDQSILENISSASLSGLQTLMSPGRSLLWLLNGFYGGANPYHSASVGLARTAKSETPNFRLQFLDIDTLIGMGELVAETFLRFVYPTEHEDEVSSTLWMTEDEITIIQGKVMLPRIKPIPDMNRRLNSRRRAVNYSENMAHATVELTLNGETRPFVYEASSSSSSSGTVMSSISHQEEHKVAVTVSYSSVWAINVSKDSNLFLGIGTIASGRRVLFFSDMCSSNVMIPPSWTQDLKPTTMLPDDMVLALFLRAIVASRIVNSHRERPVIIIEPDNLLISAISLLQPASDGVLVINVTSDSKRAQDDPRLTFIHPRSTNRAVAEALPSASGVVIDISGSSKSILGNLLQEKTCFATFKLFAATPQHIEKGSILDTIITTAFTSFRELGLSAIKGQVETDSLMIKSLSALVGQGSQPYLTMVNWRKEPMVALKVRPLKLDFYLSGAKTYLLVGLTGELGESLCRLMAAHGARYFVVASR